MSALDDRRRLVSDEPPGATFASPNGEVAIVNVHDRAGHQDLCRHPFGHQLGAIALAAPSSAESITATPWGREGEVPSCRGGRRPGWAKNGAGGSMEANAILPKSQKYIKPLRCSECGGSAVLIRRSPHPLDGSETRTFECQKCEDQRDGSSKPDLSNGYWSRRRRPFRHRHEVLPCWKVMIAEGCDGATGGVKRRRRLRERITETHHNRLFTGRFACLSTRWYFPIQHRPLRRALRWKVNLYQ